LAGELAHDGHGAMERRQVSRHCWRGNGRQAPEF
jgi:hypothetical protein